MAIECFIMQRFSFLLQYRLTFLYYKERVGGTFFCHPAIKVTQQSHVSIKHLSTLAPAARVTNVTLEAKIHFVIPPPRHFFSPRETYPPAGTLQLEYVRQ
jgi:hypothetical protein